MSPATVLAAWLAASASAAAPGPPPSVSVVSPPPGASLAGNVVLSATAAARGGVAGVQFLLDGAALGPPLTTPPYTMFWDTTRAAGDTHLLSATVWDGAGSSATAAGVTVIVDNAVRAPAPPAAAAAPAAATPPPDTRAPLVLIMNPAPSASLSSFVTISVNASDDVGVASVTFLLDGAELAPALSSAPYTLRWNTAFIPDGTHALAAVARDAAGNAATSVVNVTVDNTPPVIGPPAAAGVSAQGADVIWKTDKPSDSAVDYGPTPGYGFVAAGPSGAIGHAVALKGLAPVTLYHFRVRSKSASGLQSASPDLTFTTQPAAAGAPRAAAAPAAASDGAKAPQRFLSPALPDGINDAATFGPAAKEVSIFDVRGRRVFRAESAGTPLVWRCRDESGRVVESGLYVAKIVTRDSKVLYQSFTVAK